MLFLPSKPLQTLIPGGRSYLTVLLIYTELEQLPRLVALFP